MANRRLLVAFLVALVAAATAAGWLTSLAKAWRQGQPSAEQAALAAVGAPLLLVSIVVLSRILYLTRRAVGKGEKRNVQNHAQS